AVLRTCPGYCPADGGKLVARQGALRRPREQSAEWHNFPEAVVNPLSADIGESVARLSAARAGNLVGTAGYLNPTIG
ncbi:hypothetical protein, partial [Klebsiella oxytoca]|uniref:hypothetical protein n=1 Tax=Klebsiella oxytoca TaxID=571 RepID=UPI001954DDBE